MIETMLDILRDFLLFSVVVCLPLFTVLTLGFGGFVYVVGVSTSPDHCTLKQGSSVIYEGPGYKVGCQSTGATTKCSIGFLKTEKVVMGNNLNLECK